MAEAADVTVSFEKLLDEGIHRLVKKAVEYDKNIQILFYSDEYLCSTDRYLVVNGEDEKFLMYNIDMEALLAMKPNSYRTRLLPEGSPLINHVQVHGRDLSEYYWHAVYASGHGKLLEGLQETDVISLKCWPNLTRLVKSENAYRMAALFVSRPTTMDVASRLLSVPMDELRMFYSAAFSSGYAEPVNRAASTNISLKPHKYVKVIRNLLGVIGGGNKRFA